MSESYESAYLKLEKIIEALESEDITLEESIKKYEEGLKLYKYCSNILNEYEGKVKILTGEGDALKEEDFHIGESDEE
ncbi:exodeoxyribonuclease VII small subunit [Peptoniphilus catoniae]|uniref:exodeoxyribonuclease VII small subunit n=1 Tax=Peptoniphilus catoniae TaxID=1660341 RepID=UPI0010FCEF83|nr:exodeoxyribonuclease VII small subunit [Peptoniphilus catoniae]